MFGIVFPSSPSLLSLNSLIRVFNSFQIIFILFRLTTEEIPKKPGSSNYTRNGKDGSWNSSDFGVDVKNSLDLKTTQVSFRTMKKAEAVAVGDSLSLKKEYNSHLGFFILSSIGLVAMATLTFTSVYLSRTRREQSYQRQNQDIEVCSISSLGNELW